jgi:hypothetical protein
MKSRQTKPRRRKSPQSAGQADAGNKSTSIHHYHVRYGVGPILTVDEAVKRGILKIVDDGRGTSSFLPLLPGEYKFWSTEGLPRR